jgi:hypothetical protein
MTKYCDVHLQPKVVRMKWEKRAGRYEERWDCQACIRERSSKTHYHGPFCVQGHRKTLRTWRQKPNGDWYCTTCRHVAYKRRRARVLGLPDPYPDFKPRRVHGGTPRRAA